jgi:sec-independent protein translocase protein TatB
MPPSVSGDPAALRERHYPEGVSFGLTFDKLLIILVIAVFLIGPDRLPGYAAQLARLVRTLRGFADGAKERMREEMGPEFDEVDWRKLDPRQYDPRRIIREALLDETPPASKPVSPNGPTPARPYRESAYEQRQRRLGKGRPAPFDAEAT